MNLSKMFRILIPLVLLMISALYLSKAIPRINLSHITLLSYKHWLSVIFIFLLVQLLNIYYFKLIIGRICNISSIFKLFQVLFASHSFNYAGPLKLGMPVRVVLFKQIFGIPYSTGIASVIATTGLDVLVMVALCLSFSAWIFIAPLAGLAAGVTALACLFGVTALQQKFHSAQTERSFWIARLFSELAKISPFIILYCVCIAAAKSLLTGVAGWIVLTGLGATMGLVEFVAIYLASHLAGILSLIPMGIGVKDVSIIELLDLAGATASVSIGFVAIDRLVWSLLPLLVGMLAGWHLGISTMIRSAQKEIKV